MQSRPAAAKLARVLDVIVDQQAVVEYLDCRGASDGAAELAAKRPRHRDAYGRTKHLAAPGGVVGEQLVEKGRGRPLRKIALEVLAHGAAVVGEDALNSAQARGGQGLLRVLGHAHGSISTVSTPRGTSWVPA